MFQEETYSCFVKKINHLLACKHGLKKISKDIYNYSFDVLITSQLDVKLEYNH